MKPRHGYLFTIIFLLTSSSIPTGWAQNMAMPGDLDGDGVVNHKDFFLYALTFDPVGHRSAPEGDSNDDFRIDHRDLNSAIWSRIHGVWPFPTLDPEQLGIVTGNVLQDTGDATVVIPVPDADVWIGGEYGFRFRTKTDPNGHFRVEDVPAGDALVRAKHPQYHEGGETTVVIPEDTVRVIVRLAPKRDDLADLKGFVRGLVDDGTNRHIPLAGATVRVIPIPDGSIPDTLDPNHLPGVTDPDQVTFTDRRGHYEIHDLPAGPYLMVVFAPGYEAERRETLVQSPRENIEDFLLSPVEHQYGAVSGQVFSVGAVDTPPGPLRGAVVHLEPLWTDSIEEPSKLHLPFPFYEAVTNESGEFFIDHVWPGRYRAHAWASEHHPAEEIVEVVVSETTVQDFQLEQIVIRRGNLAGTVYGVTPDNEIPVPLEDAVVALLPGRINVFPDPVFPDEGFVEPYHIRSVTTDEIGGYLFEGVPEGDYLLVARKHGWGSVTAPSTVIPNTTSLVDMTIFHVPPPEPGTLQGRVTARDEDGTGTWPVEGAHVVALPVEPDPSGWPPSWFNTPPPTTPGVVPPELRRFHTRTNDNGEYIFPRLPAGLYHVWVIAEGLEPAEAMVGVEEGETVVLDFELAPIPDESGMVMGRVFEITASGEIEPLPGASVHLDPLPLSPVAFPVAGEDKDDLFEHPFSTETDDNGHFEFADVPPGSYKLSVRADGYRTERLVIHVPPGEQVTVEIEMVPKQSSEFGELEGHVWRAEENDPAGVSKIFPDHPGLVPVPNARVIAVPFCGPHLLDFLNLDEINPGEFPCVPLTTRTNSDGFYRFHEVPAGPLVVVVLAGGYEPAVDEITIEPGDLGVLDFWLVPHEVPHEVGLSGQVTEHTEFPTFAPVPIPGALVRIEFVDPMPLDQTVGTQNVVLPPVYTTRTDDRGIYSFSDVSPGRYRMRVEADGFRPVEGMEIRIPMNHPVRHDVVLFPLPDGNEPATLRGVVQEDTGFLDIWIPIPGAVVSLHVSNDTAKPFRRTTTGPGGEFVFENLPPDRYAVHVEAEGYQPEDARVTLEPGEDEHILFELLPEQEAETGTVWGKVEYVYGEGTILPAPGLPVFLRFPESGEDKPFLPPFSTFTNLEGLYVFPEVPTGPVTVVVGTPGHEVETTDAVVRPDARAEVNFQISPAGIPVPGLESGAQMR